MLKKILLIVLILVALLLFVSFLRASQGANTSQTEPTATPAPTPVVSLTPEEYDAMIAEELQELQNEAPLLDEEGKEIPTLNVSDEEIIEIGETEAVGGM